MGKELERSSRANKGESSFHGRVAREEGWIGNGSLKGNSVRSIESSVKGRKRSIWFKGRNEVGIVFRTETIRSSSFNGVDGGKFRLEEENVSRVNELMGK